MSNNKKKLFNIRDLTKAAFLTAISIVLTRFAYFFIPLAGLPTLRISFGEMPLMMIGLIFGPIIGAVGGAAADLIGVLVNSQGTFHPGFTLSSILWGAIPGLLMTAFRKKNNYERIYSRRNISIAVTIAFIIVSVILNTIWLAQLFGEAFIVLFPGRVISAIINIPIQSYIISKLLKHLKEFIIN